MRFIEDQVQAKEESLASRNRSRQIGMQAAGWLRLGVMFFFFVIIGTHIVNAVKDEGKDSAVDIASGQQGRVRTQFVSYNTGCPSESKLVYPGQTVEFTQASTNCSWAYYMGTRGVGAMSVNNNGNWKTLGWGPDVDAPSFREKIRSIQVRNTGSEAFTFVANQLPKS